MARKLVVEIIGDASSLEKSLQQAGRQTESVGRKFAKFGAIAGAAVAGTAVVLGKKFVDAALNAQEETGKMNVAFKNAGLKAEKMTGFVNKAETAQRKLGFTNNETRDAITKFVTAGDKGVQITKDIAIASDLARFKNIDLGEATVALVRAHQGNFRALKGLGIAVPKAGTNAEKFRIVQEKLTKAIGGQADEFSKTAKGGMEQFHAQLHNLEERIGSKLLPVISKLIGFVNDLVDIFTGSGSATEKFQKGLERIGISADTSRRLIADFKEAFNDLKTVVVDVFNIIRPILEAFWQQIKGIVQLVDDLIHGRWSKLWGDAVTIVRNTVHLWVTILKTGITLLGGVALKIGKALASGILNGLAGLAGKIIDLIVAPINAIIRQINKLPFVHIKEIGAPGAAVATGAGSSRAHTGALPPATTGLAPTPHPVTGPPIGGRGSPVVMHGVTIVANNPTELLAALQRSARRQTGSRSGPFAGHTLGLT